LNLGFNEENVKKKLSLGVLEEVSGRLECRVQHFRFVDSEHFSHDCCEINRESVEKPIC
jgi:hypothetical protein